MPLGQKERENDIVIQKGGGVDSRCQYQCEAASDTEKQFKHLQEEPGQDCVQEFFKEMSTHLIQDVTIYHSEISVTLLIGDLFCFMK